MIRSVLLACVTLAFVSPAGASPAQDARQAIQAAYASMDQATAHRNASGYSAYLAPDFVGIDRKGAPTGGKEKTLEALRQAFAQVRAAKSTTQLLTLTLQDGGAVVTTRSQFSLSGTRNGKPFVLESENQERDFWIKSSGRWLLKRERVLSKNLAAGENE